ncbi:MAG: M28 family peptidase, partial [Akkermansiaceae bacterium]|nr:M28 family peptidase [Akkermansiaceae bacterium]
MGCDDKQFGEPPEPTNLTGAEAAYHHTRRILDFGPRPPASAALQKTRAYLAGQLNRSGWQVSMRPFARKVRFFNPITRKMEENRVTFTNLVARFGSAGTPDLWERPVEGLLGAHIDSKYYPRRKFVGADDAASAAGVILELARDLQSSPHLASQLELVFFDGEEAFGRDINTNDGLYGSRAYAARWRTAPRRPRFGIVLDM